MGKSLTQSFGLSTVFLTPNMSRAKLDEAEKLRRRVWYFNVSRLSGLSDYELSCRFDLDIDAKSLRKKGTARRRIFDRLRSFDEMPFRGRTEAFVYSVDNYQRIPALKGTADLYFSPFWKLISSTSIPANQLREFNIASARATGHLKLPGEYEDTNAIYASLLKIPATEYLEYLSNKSFQYEEAVNLAFEETDADLNLLCLFGGLYRESLQSGNYELAQLLEGYVGNLLQEVTEQAWVPPTMRDSLFSLTLTRIRSHLAPDEYSGLRYVEMLEDDENKGSPLAMLLDRHDRVLWDL